jgi:hypothetical protein
LSRKHAGLRPRPQAPPQRKARLTAAKNFRRIAMHGPAMQARGNTCP